MSSILDFFKMKRRDNKNEFNRLKKDFDQVKFNADVAAMNDANREKFVDSKQVSFDDLRMLNVRLENGLEQVFIGVKVGNANYIREHANGLPYDYASELSTPIVYFPDMKGQDGLGKTIALGVDDYAVFPDDGTDHPITRERVYNIYSDVSDVKDLETMQNYSTTMFYGDTYGADKATIGEVKAIQRFMNTDRVTEYVKAKIAEMSAEN